MEIGNYQHGFCLPQACSPKDISIGLQTFTGFNVKIIIDDYHEHSLEFEALEIAFTTLLVFILVFVVAGTMCELYSSLLKIEFDREIFQFLQLFSIISSTKDLFSMPQKTANNKKKTKFVGWYEFLSITWVLIAHSFSASGQRIDDTFIAYKDILGEYFGQTVFNAFNSVDTFFLLSGLLVSYLTIKELERNNGTINWFLYYFHRYVRITLVYAIIVFMFASVLRHLGPTNKIIQESVDACQKHSWENLLYIENFVSQNFGCIIQGWYLNCDMQMFLITPLILYPLYRWEKIGYAIGAIIILGSTGLLALIHYIKRDVWAATQFGSDDDFFDQNYTQPWMRIQPYMVGIFLGYLLFKTKSSFRIPKYGVAIGWILAIAVGYSCIYELHLNEHFLDNSYISIPLPARIVYGSLHRLGWGLAVGWVIFACENGYGGIINEFLSWNFFKPWSKLTFLIYLTHIVITSLIFDNMTFSTRYSPMSLLILTLGILNVSTIFAALLYIFFEVPFAKLEKYLISKIFATKKKVREL
ncbi:LOW QUALITY PROTEIN: nose resistant to fluoxetine protein 6 [Lepeophtheirus salmonis]|uniref:LOW QUALITY PROTEIN: nose resistant to fluoxetine protein 6 n=1 Tax=Lepeophtheirus salmonis TaxID=72036 RepID=UPI003AF3CF14